LSTRTSGLGRTVVARCWAGFASLGAGLVHLAVVGEHLDHWLLAGLFLAGLGAAQLGWGLAALAMERAPFPRAVIGVDVGVVALWAVSRTTGLPFGPDAGTAEALGRADLLCMALQLLVVASLVVSMRTSAACSPGTGSARVRAGRGLVALGVGALVMSALTTPALAATESGEHAHPHGSHGDDGGHHDVGGHDDHGIHDEP
jgi:hypothetical protein